jgi:hypothetical protein
MLQFHVSKTIAMPMKILVVYYTQSGQLRQIVDSVVTPLREDPEIEITFEELKPVYAFPFPWSSDSFFQAMPESVLGIPCKLEPLSLKGDENFDLVILAWQPWYLSPSIPIHAFLQLEIAQKLFSDKPVITLVGSRNMWVSAHLRIREYLAALKARPVGNIVLYDRAPNLLSVISIIRWLILGKKERYLKIIPPAGISETDIRNASRFGNVILQAVSSGNFSSLRPALVDVGAVDVKPDLIMLEKRGIIFFRIWAHFIRKRGDAGALERLFRVRLFKFYLLAVIYLASPLATLFYFITKPLRLKAIKKQISLYQSI